MKTLVFFQAVITLLLGIYLTFLASPSSNLTLFGLTGHDIAESISGGEEVTENGIKVIGIFGIFMIGFSVLELVFLASISGTTFFFQTKTKSKKYSKFKA